MAGKEHRVVTLGEAMLRLTAPAGERLARTGRLRSYVAGSEANVARALAALGVPVSWVSALPRSPLGERVLAELRAAGVDTSHVQRSERGRLGLFFVEQGAGARPSRVLYDRAGSAFALMDSLPPRALEGASHAVVSGVTPALGARTRRLAQSFAEQARRAGALLCVDVNYRSMLWSPAQARRGLSELLAQAEVVLCSERDARSVFGLAGSAAELARPFAARWAPRASTVVITRGERGSVMLRGRELLEAPAHGVEVLDRFGAGDAFMAGLLWGMCSGERAADSLALASALAALNCTVLGDAAEFTAQELRAAVQQPSQEPILR